MKKLFVCFLVCAYSSMYGQATKASQDAGLWSTINVEKKLNDKFSLFLTEEFRMRENFTRVNLFYTDIGAEVRPAKFLKLALSYRNIQKKMIDGSYEFRHRFMLDITLKKKFGNFALSYRQRLQREVQSPFTSEGGMIPEWYSRNKFTVKYDFGKPLSPYIAAEFRYQFANSRMMESDGTWHRGRYIVGVDYKRNDQNSFGLYYLVQNEFNVKSPQSIYILGLEYNFSF